MRAAAQRPPAIETIDEEAGEVYLALPDQDSDEAYREVDVLAAESVSAFGCRSQNSVERKKGCCRWPRKGLRGKRVSCSISCACTLLLAAALLAVGVAIASSLGHAPGHGRVTVTFDLPNLVAKWVDSIYVVRPGR